MAVIVIGHPLENATVGFYPPESSEVNEQEILSVESQVIDAQETIAKGRVSGVITVYQKDTPRTNYYNAVLVDEQLIGDVDGENRIFKATRSFINGTVVVFINGLKNRNFSVTGDNEITLDIAPLNVEFEDIIEAIYLQIQN